MRELLRDVHMTGNPWSYRLQLWDTGETTQRAGRFWSPKLAYRLTRLDGESRDGTPGAVIFEGEDYSVGVNSCTDDDEALSGLMSFLTLKPGDTDSEYFSKYTQEQLEWAQTSDCEELGYAYACSAEDGRAEFQDFS